MGVLSDKAVVIGISPDSIESHKKFKDKYNLNFYLLSDPNKEVLEKLLDWLYGRKRKKVYWVKINLKGRFITGFQLYYYSSSQGTG